MSGRGWEIEAAGPIPSAPAPFYGEWREEPTALARSRLNRSGLKAGAVAPEFRLPRVDGEELSPADFRGRRVLLVFSDPHCGPCDQLVPLLEELHLERPDLQVLVISRRDAEATGAKAAALGLTFPNVMQRGTSRIRPS